MSGEADASRITLWGCITVMGRGLEAGQESCMSAL